MRKALRLALRGRGCVEPNPMVGCVVVRGGLLLGEGWHRGFGGPHAEVEALADCQRRGHDAAGGDVYVTLEPCCHHGKTGPCTKALIEAGVRRVFAAIQDPFQEAAGQGLAALGDAGIAVEVGLCEDLARRLNEPYLKRVCSGLPWVIAKWAQTLDGRIATAKGDSQWISNEISRRWVHRLRGRVDAVMVGIGTVLKDDPLLTARELPVRRIARRVVVDPKLHIEESCAMLEACGEGEQVTPPVTIGVGACVRDQAREKWRQLEARGVELVALPQVESGDKGIDLRPLLEHLTATHSATNVLVEGGAGLVGHLFRQGLVDQVLVFIAPKLLADERAIPAVRGFSRESIVDATAMELRRVKRLGDDVALDYRVRGIG